MPLKLLVSGASGRMGQSVIELGKESCEIVGQLSKEEPDWKPEYAKADVVVDFSNPEFLPVLLGHCDENKISTVICTTGYSESVLKQIEDLSKKVPVVLASNTSIGVTILNKLVSQCAKAAGNSFDIEIFEAHHRNKVDSPSGTALSLCDSAIKGRAGLKIAGADRNGKRQEQEIGFSVVRGGGIFGEHSVMFISENEKIELSHTALNRKVFAEGALFAANWLSASTPKPGLYSMEDILFG